MQKLLVNSILQQIQDPILKDKNIELFIKRDDLIHPEVSGNKWRKLKYFISKMQQQQKIGILTFGGAYSNHILATASSACEFGFKSIALIRGEELNNNSNETLKRCTVLGMELIFVTREEYDLRNDWDQRSLYKNKFSEYLIVPEGGAGFEGLIGCQEIISELPHFDHLFVSAGTATTASGLLLGLPEGSTLNVVPAIKNFHTKENIRELLSKSGFESEFVQELLENVCNHPDYSFGGYAKVNDELQNFIIKIKQKFDLDLDPIYTGKAFFGMWNEILNNPNFENKRIIFLHTGGLRRDNFL